MADTNFHDRLPNVVLEAMAAGRPVILSPLPAAQEALTDGAEGFILSSAQDEEGFAAALAKCGRQSRQTPSDGPGRAAADGKLLLMKKSMRRLERFV